MLGLNCQKADKFNPTFVARFASLALAMLYLTVLGFNSVTTGYLLTQGVSEAYIAFAMATGTFCAIDAWEHFLALCDYIKCIRMF